MKASVLFVLLMFFFPFINVAQSETGAEGKRAGDSTTVRVKSKKLPWDWHLRSFEQDSVYGAAVYQAYDYLKDREPKAKIVVAIIDGGAEITHHNLKNALWRNPGEIPGNGIDDDNNGYVDDVHGWNFLGHPDGRSIHGVQIADAEFVRLREKYENADTLKLSKKEYKEYRYFKDIVCKFSQLAKYGTPEIIADYAKMIAEKRADRLSLGDDVNSMKNCHYGNNNLLGDDTFHGSHVAGIVGAARGEERGIKGIASVELMIIKVLDDGDEEDKDVASAIYYAVDNGAKVINMSLTKYISFNRKLVDDAMRYAERKGVLIVKAAGNDSCPIDEYPCYPNQFPGKKKALKNFICVGSIDASPVARASDFSNYGKKSVDIFAPGDFIFSTALRGKYRRLSGTSMAAPVVAGVAALIWNYFPELSMSQVRQAILEGASSWKGRQVSLPGGNGKKVDFGELCTSGGILNALQAVKIAEQMSKK